MEIPRAMRTASIARISSTTPHCIKRGLFQQNLEAEIREDKLPGIRLTNNFEINFKINFLAEPIGLQKKRPYRKITSGLN